MRLQGRLLVQAPRFADVQVGVPRRPQHRLRTRGVARPLLTRTSTARRILLRVRKTRCRPASGIAARDMPVDARRIRCQPARSWSLPSRSVRAAASSSLGRAPPVFIPRYGAQPVATFLLLTTILMEPAASANPVRRVHHAVAQRSPCQTTTRRAAAGSKTGHHYRRRSCIRGTWVSIRPG